MTFNSSRRGFLRGVGGMAMLGAAGCCTSWCKRSGKIRLAAVGIMGKGFSDWMPMLKSGLAEIVAFCDADANQRTEQNCIRFHAPNYTTNQAQWAARRHQRPFAPADSSTASTN